MCIEVSFFFFKDKEEGQVGRGCLLKVRALATAPLQVVSHQAHYGSYLEAKVYQGHLLHLLQHSISFLCVSGNFMRQATKTHHLNESLCSQSIMPRLKYS